MVCLHALLMSYSQEEKSIIVSLVKQDLRLTPSIKPLLTTFLPLLPYAGSAREPKALSANPGPQYREYTVYPFRVQLAAIYLMRLLVAVSHFIIPLGHTMQFTGCHYDNHMRNKICMARKNSMEQLYSIFTLLCQGHWKIGN